MTTKLTNQQVHDRIVQAATDVVKAEFDFREARNEVKNQFNVYFRAFGRPEGQFLPYDDAWAGSVRFTAAANARRSKARKVLTNAKARLERAVHALERAQ